jgi:hypothetical protein
MTSKTQNQTVPTLFPMHAVGRFLNRQNAPAGAIYKAGLSNLCVRSIMRCSTLEEAKKKVDR